LQEIAEEKNCTAAQLALAWLLRRNPDVIPIPGTSSATRLEENCGAAGISLSEEDLSRIEAALPKGAAEGDRYSPAMMRNLNG
jgi:aryl-alcohol dehydrogenase-like predicted oxidoreductase